MLQPQESSDAFGGSRTDRGNDKATETFSRNSMATTRNGPHSTSQPSTAIMTSKILSYLQSLLERSALLDSHYLYHEAYFVSQQQAADYFQTHGMTVWCCWVTLLPQLKLYLNPVYTPTSSNHTNCSYKRKTVLLQTARCAIHRTPSYLQILRNVHETYCRLELSKVCHKLWSTVLRASNIQGQSRNWATLIRPMPRLLLELENLENTKYCLESQGRLSVFWCIRPDSTGL